MAKYRLVDIDKLSPGSVQQRKFFPGVVELATLIEENGWIMPLDVTPDGTITAGERRWRAASLLNERAEKEGEERPWPKLPCMVEEGSDDELFDRNVAENSGRVDLRFIEISRIMQKYRNERGLDNDSIGRKTGYRPETVSRYISILEKTHPDIIARLDNGEQIPLDLLIKIHTIRDKDVQLLRLNQWLGNPTESTETEAPNRARKTAISRRKMLALIPLLEKANYPAEAIVVAQFIAGIRTSLPGKLHQRLSRGPRPRRED